MALHNFYEDVEWSERQSDDPFWEVVYRQAFPDFASMTSLKGKNTGQLAGIDRVIQLTNGKTLNIDEKTRKKSWTDVLLEKWSSIEHKRPGWIEKDLACDYIAYAFLPGQVCYMLPFIQLRRAWIKHGVKWERDYGTIKARNEGYTTVSVPVPIGVLLQAMTDALWTCWGTRLFED